MKMKLIYKAFFFFLYCNGLFSQKITIYNGLNTNLTDQKVKMINSKEDFSNNGGFGEIEYEQNIAKKMSICFSYFKYEGITLIRFNAGSLIQSNGVGTDAIGFSGIYFDRFNLFSRYKFGNKLALEPGIGLSYQKSHDKGYEAASLSDVNGPDYICTGEKSFSYTKSQIVPIADLRLSYTFFKLISFNLRVAGAYGFKSHQDFYFEYKYKDVQQPTALFQARGKGLFYTAGISINFATIYTNVKKMI